MFTFDDIDHDAVLPVAGGGAGVVAGVRGRGVLPDTYYSELCTVATAWMDMDSQTNFVTQHNKWSHY